MGRPDDALLILALQRTLGLRHAPRLDRRTPLHGAPGRGVERISVQGCTLVVKWRDDRPRDREALLYRSLSPQVHRALGAPPFLGALTVADTHLLFLGWVEGVRADWSNPLHVRRAWRQLGRLHARTAAWIASDPASLATPEGWAELGPTPPAPAAAPDPLVLDPGDLHGDNVLLCRNGRICFLDFENMAVRPRALALRPLWHDGALPQGELQRVALSSYWTAARWPGSPPQRPEAQRV
jgi:hypothetical protein